MQSRPEVFDRRHGLSCPGDAAKSAPDLSEKREIPARYLPLSLKSVEKTFTVAELIVAFAERLLFSLKRQGGPVR
jgi:hypothetical protein